MAAVPMPAQVGCDDVVRMREKGGYLPIPSGPAYRERMTSLLISPYRLRKPSDNTELTAARGSQPPKNGLAAATDE